MRTLPQQGLFRSRAETCLRVGIALILLTAAVLKAHQLATTPSLGEGLFHARWFNILVVQFELFFGIWLFVFLPKLTWASFVEVRISQLLCATGKNYE